MKKILISLLLFINLNSNSQTLGSPCFFCFICNVGLTCDAFCGKCQLNLPIELIDFTCNSESNDIIVNWSTATETNNKEFEIYRSINGIDFVKISTIKGVGSSNNTSYYQYIDYFPNIGDNYYKLIQIDNNGKITPYKVTYCNFIQPINNYIIKYYNLLGQVINIDYFNGFYIKETNNNNSIKREIKYKLN